jgi:hypothetical protein
VQESLITQRWRRANGQKSLDSPALFEASGVLKKRSICQQNAAFIFARVDFVKVHCEKFRAIAVLFRRHQNNAHKLKHCGGKLENDYSEEWGERAEDGGIV